MDILRNFYNSLSDETLIKKYDKKDIIALGKIRTDGSYFPVATTYEDMLKAFLNEQNVFKSSPLGVLFSENSFENLQKNFQETGGFISSLDNVDPDLLPDSGLYILCDGRSFLGVLNEFVDPENSDNLKDVVNLSKRNFTFSEDVKFLNSQFAKTLNIDASESNESETTENPEKVDEKTTTASDEYGNVERPSSIFNKVILPEIVEIGSFKGKSAMKDILLNLFAKNFKTGNDYLLEEEISEFESLKNLAEFLSLGVIIYVDQNKKVVFTSLFVPSAKKSSYLRSMIYESLKSKSKNLMFSYQLSIKSEEMLYDLLSSTPKRVRQRKDEVDNNKQTQL